MSLKNYLAFQKSSKKTEKNSNSTIELHTRCKSTNQKPRRKILKKTLSHVSQKKINASLSKKKNNNNKQAAQSETVDLIQGQNSALITL